MLAYLKQSTRRLELRCVEKGGGASAAFMGGALIETVRQWCRHRWSRLNSPCIASDAVAPESTLDFKSAHKTHIDAPHKGSRDLDFFTEYGEANRYLLQEVIGKGSYGIVCSAIDTYTGEKVAIKKITDIFEHVSDAMRILREIKLLRLLHHPDIVEIRHIMLPPSPRDFKDIYVVFELMESDLHQVIKANDDLKPEHYRFFLYQLLRALKFIHTANVFHRDLKPKNVLANADCKLKICDFGLARVAFDDSPTAIFWTDYVATRWYRAPELCGSFFSKYTPAVDIWSIGCIFAEILGGKPLFPGKNVVHQLDLITDLLGTPSLEVISKIRNDKARKYLSGMRQKHPLPLSQKFPKADPQALCLLSKLLAFDPKDRPTAAEALADPYFIGLAKIECEPSALPIAKVEFDFERRKRVSKEDVKYLICREILEYHPQMLEEHISVEDGRRHFLYPSAVDQLRKQFLHLEEQYFQDSSCVRLERRHASLSREYISGLCERLENSMETGKHETKREVVPCAGSALRASERIFRGEDSKPNKVVVTGTSSGDTASKNLSYPRRLMKSASVNSSSNLVAPMLMSRNASTKRLVMDPKKEDSLSDIPVVQSRSHFFGFSLTRKIAAGCNDRPRR